MFKSSYTQLSPVHLVWLTLLVKFYNPNMYNQCSLSSKILIAPFVFFLGSKKNMSFFWWWLWEEVGDLSGREIIKLVGLKEGLSLCSNIYFHDE